MSNSFVSFGVVIHSSPCVGCHAIWPGGPYVSMEMLEKPYCLAKSAMTLLSRNGPEYSLGGRTRWYGTSSSTWCIARSPETSLMIAVIWACVRSVRSSRSWARALPNASEARRPIAFAYFAVAAVIGCQRVEETHDSTAVP